MASLTELYLEAIEACNAHDLDALLGYYADDCENVTHLWSWRLIHKPGRIYLVSGRA